MDKYPVLAEGEAAGELTVVPDALYTVFDVSCPGREGLWCAWVVGEKGRFRIGIPEPEGGLLHIRRRFSRQLTEPAGLLLRGELRPLGEEGEHWVPLRVDTLQSPYLRSRLGPLPGVLTCREKDGCLIAVPRDDARPFPLEAMFCFARPRRLKNGSFWVFRFDGREWPVF